VEAPIVSAQFPSPSVPTEPGQEPAGKPEFAPYDLPAGGWGALHATAKALRDQSVELKGCRALLSMNQPDGFDCPGCAWPDPRHTSSFEFCENGAKAVTWELTKNRVTREFFAAHIVRELEQGSDCRGCRPTGPNSGNSWAFAESKLPIHRFVIFACPPRLPVAGWPKHR
jgi:hypothetical protein